MNEIGWQHMTDLLSIREIGLPREVRETLVWFPRHPHQRDLRGEDLILTAPYGHVWNADGIYHRWILPVDFLHDGASVPDLVRPLVPKRVLARVSPHHDRGYRTLGLPPVGEHETWSVGRGKWVDAHVDLFAANRIPWTRWDLDRLMGAMMREDPDGPSRPQRRWTFRGIRVGGHFAWRRQMKAGPVL